ncbi:MAG TPA: hypothetical protein VMB52_02490 [Verrucomicrobiae bacterium]|nr:hypothetical protein [Verrucomicrobiae bacterium]
MELHPPTRRRESRHHWLKPVSGAVAAAALLAACSSGTSANSSVGQAAPRPSATGTAQPRPTTAPPTGQVDPRAYACDVTPNPHPGTYEECPIPGGSPVFRYTNLSDPQAPIPYSVNEPPTYVQCRIPQDELPPDVAQGATTLHNGGVYTLLGGSSVAAADNFFNPTVEPASSFDPGVPLCDEVAIEAVTAPS